ncbi:Glycosyltransferase sugar-binding region containing DXD motif-containing protein [Lachnospiraceae bacterium]|nr:Glycosyltransferase sugar-binding region containing DXD motif-containing protein [Lachnospiraceae bacterium]
MVRIINRGPEEFRKYIVDKKVIIFGAGRATESSLDIYFAEKKPEMIIDNSPDKWGTYIEHLGQKIPIVGIEALRNITDKQNYLIFISSPFYAADIVEQLDGICEIDGMECFLQVLIRYAKEKINDYSFSEGEERIPKKIHYIWLGNKEIPREFRENIKSWKMHNPDYEIVEWNEDNYDFGKCVYAKEALEAHAYGFASNYARLDIIYNEGGIYLDTDVKALKNFDCLLHDRAFFNMGSADRVNNGCGFGAEKGSSIVKELLDVYNGKHFLLPNGKPGKKQGHTFLHPVLKKHGFEIKNQYQKIDDVVLYPSEVMSPKTLEGMEDMFSDKTVSVHLESGSWRNEKEQAGMEKLLGLLKSGRIDE